MPAFGHGGNRQHRDPGERGAAQQLGDLPHDLLRALFRDAVDLGDDRDAFPHAEEIEYVQVLDRLRHHPVVRGDDQQRVVDAADAGEHVADEALVPRHVDEADQPAAFERQVGETEVDGDAARLFLRQAVGVHARERLHEERLAVVDVSCGGDDHLQASSP